MFLLNSPLNAASVADDLNSFGAYGKLIAIGDSLFSNGIGSSSPDSTFFHQRGDINWLQALAGYPFVHEAYYDGSDVQGHNVGVGSEETKDMLARIKTGVLDKNPDIVFIRAGTNDIEAGRSAATIIRNLTKMIDECRHKGAKVWIDTIFPRNDSDGNEFSSGEDAIRVAVNTWVLNVADNIPGVTAINSNRLLDAGDGTLNTAYSYDGLHINSRGAYTIANGELLPKWRKYAGISRIPSYTPEDYNASTVPYGNILTNSAFTGSGGTASTGVSGTLPDSWRAEYTGGTDISSVASVVSQTDWNGETRNFIRHAISGSGGGVDGEMIRTRPTTTSITSVAAGWYEAEVEVIVSSGGTENFLRSLILEVRDQQGTDSYFRCFTLAYDNGSVKDEWPQPDSDLRLLLRAPKILVDSGGTGVTFYVLIACDCTIDGDVTVDIGKPHLVPHYVGGVAANFSSEVARD